LVRMSVSVSCFLFTAAASKVSKARTIASLIADAVYMAIPLSNRDQVRAPLRRAPGGESLIACRDPFNVCEISTWGGVHPHSRILLPQADMRELFRLSRSTHIGEQRQHIECTNGTAHFICR